MRREEHEEESIRLFGKPFTEVHQWLDAFAGTPEYGFRHRKVRHHEKGIEEARKLFGDEGAEAARQHIISDLATEGWEEALDPFPKDEKDYHEIGFF
jgi:hypothetical protein